MNTSCPECGQPVHGKSCACGWKMITDRKSPTSAYESLRCLWNNLSGQCQLLGAIGTGGKFYCLYHYDHFSKPKDAQFREVFNEWHKMVLTTSSTKGSQYDVAAEVLWYKINGCWPRVAIDQKGMEKEYSQTSF